MATVTRLLAVGALAGLLSACSPEIVGSIGISVTEAGDVVGVANGCTVSLSGADLYGPDFEVIATWDLEPWIVRKPAMTWHQTGSPADTRWRTVPALQRTDFAAASTYTLRGGTDDDWATLGDVTFTGADLAALRPGQILITEWVSTDDAAPAQPRSTLASRADFDRRACESSTP